MYGNVCIHLTNLSHEDCDNTYTLSYFHHQIGNMAHLPLFKTRSWNNGMRCMSFYIRMGKYDQYLDINIYIAVGYNYDLGIHSY